MNDNERFERLAKAFHEETGIYAPGKDLPPHQPDVHGPALRMMAWREWLDTRGVELQREWAEGEAFDEAEDLLEALALDLTKPGHEEQVVVVVNRNELLLLLAELVTLREANAQLEREVEDWEMMPRSWEFNDG